MYDKVQTVRRWWGEGDPFSELPMMASMEQRPVQQKPKACSLQLDQALLANN